MPVVAARGEELGQHELVQRGGPGTDAGQLRDDRRHEVLGRHQPGQPHRGRQRLARRAAVDDVVGGQRLHRAERSPVVAELAVVVVLDQNSAAGAGPLHELGAVLERDAQRELVGRGEQDGVDVLARQLRARRADRQADQAQARVGQDRPVHPQAVGLHAHAPGAEPVQCGGQRAEALPEARAHDDPFRCDAHAPRAGEVAGERCAQLGQALRVGVAVGRGRRPPQRRPRGGEPLAVRERRDVGVARPQVVGDGSARCGAPAPRKAARPDRTCPRRPAAPAVPVRPRLPRPPAPRPRRRRARARRRARIRRRPSRTGARRDGRARPRP